MVVINSKCFCDLQVFIAVLLHAPDPPPFRAFDSFDIRAGEPPPLPSPLEPTSLFDSIRLEWVPPKAMPLIQVGILAAREELRLYPNTGFRNTALDAKMGHSLVAVCSPGLLQLRHVRHPSFSCTTQPRPMCPCHPHLPTWYCTRGSVHCHRNGRIRSVPCRSWG